MQATLDCARDMVGQYPFLDCRLSPITMGHINETYRVDHLSGTFILQRLSPIFSPSIHYSIQTVTEHLLQRHFTTPTLICNREGKLWTVDAQGGVWRAMTYIFGEVVVQPKSAAMCQSAGHLLGRFHRAVEHLACDFPGARVGVHDTPKHRALLVSALDHYRSHPYYDEVAKLAEPVIRALDALPDPQALPERIVHGDPKISNFVFDAAREAHALIDLDTLSRMPAPLELGDAFRSWCNPGGEGESITSFRLDYFQAGLAGYAQGSGALLTPEEQRLVPDMVSLITLELTTRFLRDALEESYFGWDKKRFTRASEHNLVRANSQWALARAYAGLRDDARRQAEAVFGAQLPV